MSHMTLLTRRMCSGTFFLCQSMQEKLTVADSLYLQMERKGGTTFV